MHVHKNRTTMNWLVAALIANALFVSACVAPTSTALVQPMTQDAEQTTAPRVYFTEPTDGAILASPLVVKMSAENFVVEPADNGINAGKGHLHIMLDAECVAPGNGIPKDETHLHYGKGQLEAELTLAPGEHTLCLQAADGAHIALEGEGMTHVIRVVVE